MIIPSFNAQILPAPKTPYHFPSNSCCLQKGHPLWLSKACLSWDGLEFIKHSFISYQQPLSQPPKPLVSHVNNGADTAIPHFCQYFCPEMVNKTAIGKIKIFEKKGSGWERKGNHKYSLKCISSIVWCSCFHVSEIGLCLTFVDCWEPCLLLLVALPCICSKACRETPADKSEPFFYEMRHH